ncbi:MAG: hypothetical protein EBR82_77435 [Caulobacteraceae bacterium]|nr:hypothetical protein [Caulobacteraceae bacterium]NBZ96350.1 hypothetical protein [Pseudomonadota bacterium]NDG19103.1 hypothetical protein [Betaproteobacteria bacterium]
MTIPEALAYLRTLCLGGPPTALEALDELEAAWRRERELRSRVASLAGQSTSDAKRDAARRNIAKATAARLARQRAKVS